MLPLFLPQNGLDRHPLQYKFSKRFVLEKLMSFLDNKCIRVYY